MGSRGLMEQFLAFAKVICPETRASVRPCGKMYRVSLSGRFAVSVIEHLYENCNVALHRKARRAKRILELVRGNRYSGRAIEPRTKTTWKLSNDVKDSIAAEYLKGSSSSSLARKHGMSASGIMYVLGVRGVKRRGPSECHKGSRGPRKLSDETELTIVDEYFGGLSSEKLGAKYGVSPSAVLGILRRHGISPGEFREERRRKLPNEVELAAVDEYLGGGSLKDVGAKYGVCSQTVLNILRRHGRHGRIRRTHLGSQSSSS